MNDPLHLVCPHCQAINRVPTNRLTETPRCGQCHQPLFTAHPVELTTATFERHINRNDIPVLVDFWAPWCGPCRMMAPAFEQAAAQLEPQVRLAKVNTEMEATLSARFGIRSIPTLALFKGGPRGGAATGRHGRGGHRALGAGAGLRVPLICAAPVKQEKPEDRVAFLICWRRGPE